MDHLLLYFSKIDMIFFLKKIRHICKYLKNFYINNHSWLIDICTTFDHAFNGNICKETLCWKYFINSENEIDSFFIKSQTLE